jgi:hypothetical protein
MSIEYLLKHWESHCLANLTYEDAERYRQWRKDKKGSLCDKLKGKYTYPVNLLEDIEKAFIEYHDLCEDRKKLKEIESVTKYFRTGEWAGGCG